MAMESSSVYWIPVFQIFEIRGFEVFLVNAKSMKGSMDERTQALSFTGGSLVAMGGTNAQNFCCGGLAEA